MAVYNTNSNRPEVKTADRMPQHIRVVGWIIGLKLCQICKNTIIHKDKECCDSCYQNSKQTGPVYEHIRVHGAGIDMTGIWTDGKSNLQLRKKNLPLNMRNLIIL